MTPRRCLGITVAGRVCQIPPGHGRLFCRHHAGQGLPCFGGPGDGVRVLAQDLGDLPFTSWQDEGGEWQFDRVGAGHPVPAELTGWYVLAAHPVTGRPCARWRELARRPADTRRESERGPR